MSDRGEFAHRYLDGCRAALAALDTDRIAAALAELEAARRADRTIFLAGNGGSAATASHIANDFVWGLSRDGGRGLRAVSLGDCAPLLTAIANDAAYSEVFVPGLRTLARANDVLLVISGSGNSANVLRALHLAKQIEMRTIGFLGMDGGNAGPLCDVSVVVPSLDYGFIEDAHLALGHLCTAWLREAARGRVVSPGG